MNEREVFGLFFGVFWASVLLSSARYRLFDTHDLLRGTTVRRLLVGVVVLNVLPIAWFGWLATTLQDGESFWGLAAGAAAALSAFGFQRFAHAIVFTRWRDVFYDAYEQAAILQSWDRPHQGSLRSHLVGALLYLVVPPVVAVLLQGIGSA